VFLRFQVFGVVNAVSLHCLFQTLWRWQDPPKQQEPLTQWHIITSQNTQILTTTAVVSTVGYVFTEVVSRVQEGSTIAQFSNYSVRVLEYCTRMWPPAISVIYCQHNEWDYKQPLYIMLKYGSLQRETMATSKQEKIYFRWNKENEDRRGNYILFFSFLLHAAIVISIRGQHRTAHDANSTYLTVLLFSHLLTKGTKHCYRRLSTAHEDWTFQILCKKRV